MPRISIIIPVFNKATHLPTCLDSVLSQTLRDIEVICIDNNSTDDSLRILQDRTKKDSRLIVTNEMRQGPSFARNTGLNVAQSDYIGFIDADDFIDNTYFARLVEACESYDAPIATCGFDHYYPDADTRCQAILPSPSPAFCPTDIGSRIFWTTTPSVCTKVFKRSFIEANGLRFNTSLSIAEDTLFSYGAIMQAPTVATIPEPLYHYRQKVTGQITDNARHSGTQIFDALALIEQKIPALEAGASFIDGLLNYSCEGARYVLSISQTYAEYESIFTRFQQEWAPRVAALPHNALHPEIIGFWERYCASSNAAELLHSDMRMLNNCIQDKDTAIRHLEDSTARLSAKIDAVENSTMLRVGKAATALPRAVKDVLKHRGK